MTEPKNLGRVSHYYDQIAVAVVKLDGDLRVGDQVRFLGHDADFIQIIGSMQQDHQEVKKAGKGQEVGIQVDQRVEKGTNVLSV